MKLSYLSRSEKWGQKWGQANLIDLFGRRPSLKLSQSVSITPRGSRSLPISPVGFSNQRFNTWVLGTISRGDIELSPPM
jgi:hypothetical protein